MPPKTSLLPLNLPSATARRQNSAFTLVETVIALGIFAFAIVSVLGVLPSALTTIHQSARAQVTGEIIATMTSELRANPKALTGFPRFFDDRGAVVSTSANAAYRVELSSTTAVKLDGDDINSSLQAAALQLSVVQGANQKMVFQVSVPSL